MSAADSTSQGLRYLILTRRGCLAGILTKGDIHDHLDEEGISSARADLLRRRHGGDTAALRSSTTSNTDQFDDSRDADALLADETDDRHPEALDRP
jgi:hypothetical protein